MRGIGGGRGIHEIWLSGSGSSRSPVGWLGACVELRFGVVHLP